MEDAFEIYLIIDSGAGRSSMTFKQLVKFEN